MKNNFNNDIDNENLNIANLLFEDSEKLNTDDAFNEDIIRQFKDSKRKKTPARKFYTFASAAACVMLIIGATFFARNTLTPNVSPVESSKLKSPLNENSSGNTTSLSTAQSYADIYNHFLTSVKHVSLNYYGDGDLYQDSANGLIPKALGTSSTNNTAENSSVFYDTNRQTENVYEGDIVKTDGNYIYTLNSITRKTKENSSYTYKVTITKADGMKLKTVSEILLGKKQKNVNQSFYELYVYENKLIIIGSKCEFLASDYVVNRKYEDCIAVNSDSQEMFIYTYDISDKKKPKLLSENKQEGYYNSSRLNNGYLYTISDIYISMEDENNCVPKIDDTLISPEAVYLPANINNTEYTVITTLNINEPDSFCDSIAVAGGASMIYASEDNIYLINNINEDKDISNTAAGKKAFDKARIKIFKHKKIKVKESIRKYIQKTYKNVNPKKVTAYKETRAYKRFNNVSIIKYQYVNGKIKFVADATIDGYSYDNLNFDEKDGYLRFVTTESNDTEVITRLNYYDEKGNLLFYDTWNSWWIKSSKETSNVFVLDENFNKKAEINNIAKGESIYSSRFLGDYGYFVTYENKDPLFSVDFSDIENPKIIGKLELPGFSSYLHFYSEDSLFGFGMDTDEDTGRDKGLKMEMYKLKSGKAHTESKLVLKGYDASPALEDYKAIMIDPKKNLIGFTATDFHLYTLNDTTYFVYTYKNNKFKQLLKTDLRNHYYTRGLYIGDYLYIVEPNYQIRAFNLKTYAKDKKVEIEKLN